MLTDYKRVSLSVRATAFYAHMVQCSNPQSYNQTWRVADISRVQRISKTLALKVFKELVKMNKVSYARNPYHGNSSVWLFQLKNGEKIGGYLNDYHYGCLDRVRHIAKNKVSNLIEKGL